MLDHTFPIFSDYSKVVTFPDCGTRHCVNLSIEDDLRVTSTQRVNIMLNSTDIEITQRHGMIAVDRPGMCDYMCSTCHQIVSIRESVDSLCRDGTNAPQGKVATNTGSNDTV